MGSVGPLSVILVTLLLISVMVHNQRSEIHNLSPFYMLYIADVYSFPLCSFNVRGIFFLFALTES